MLSKLLTLAAVIAATATTAQAVTLDAGKYKFTLLDSDAGWETVLRIDDHVLSNRDDIGSFIVVNHDGGDLFFDVKHHGYDIKTTMLDGIIYLDDGGAGPDLDYNDMVVGVQPVPIPAALPLMAFGLCALGVYRKTKKEG